MEARKYLFNYASRWTLLGYSGLSSFFLGIGILCLYQGLRFSYDPIWIAIGILDVLLGLFFFVHQTSFRHKKLGSRLFFLIGDSGIRFRTTLYSREKHIPWEQIGSFTLRKKFLKIELKNGTSRELVTTAVEPGQLLDLILHLRHNASRKGIAFDE